MPGYLIANLPLKPILKDLHYKFHSFHHLSTSFDSSWDYNILTLRVDTYTRLPKTEYIFRPAQITDLVSNQLIVRENMAPVWLLLPRRVTPRLPGFRLSFTREINQAFLNFQYMAFR